MREYVQHKAGGFTGDIFLKDGVMPFKDGVMQEVKYGIDINFVDVSLLGELLGSDIRQIGTWNDLFLPETPCESVHIFENRIILVGGWNIALSNSPISNQIISIYDIGEITSLGDSCFQGCDQLIEIKLPNVTTLGDSCFQNCVALVLATFPAVINLGDSCFQNCGSLVSIDVSLAESIGDYCFNNCFELQSVILYNTVVIASYAFKNCSKLYSIIAGSAISIGAYCFENCENITEYQFGINILPEYCFKGSGIQRISSTDFINLTNIGEGCFQACSKLAYVELPLITNVPNNCFKSCHNLNTAYLEAALTFGDYVFTECISLVVVYTNISSIGISCFKNCKSLVQVNNLEKLNELTSQCFSGCTSLDTVYLPLVTSVQGMAFYNCKCLRNISFYSALVNFKDFVFYNCTSLRNIRFYNKSVIFNGNTPHIDISSNPLSKSSIETLFDDLPSNVTSKTINIATCPGTDTLITKTGVDLTTVSNTIPISDTSLFKTGMEVYGDGLSFGRSVTFTDTGDLVNRTNHGLSNGMKISFLGITSTTGISNKTVYFVVNKTTNTFQVSLTAGGAAIELTTNGSGSVVVIPKIASISTNTSIVLDVPCNVSTLVTLTAGLLERSKAILKGWTITN